MLPRHRTPPSPQPGGAAQLHLHVRRIVLDERHALGMPPADLPQALQRALAAELAGQQPAVNHVTPLHELARSVGAHLQPALAQPATVPSTGGGS